MIFALVLAALYAVSAGDATCRSGFSYYQGWCVYSTYPAQMSYNDAKTICANMGYYAPSIHSDDDFNFWKNSVNTVVGAHFWLDAYCPSAGQLYKWLDGTATNYYGPHNELQQCTTGDGYHMHNTGFDKYPYGEPALGLCAYECAQCSDTTPSSTSTTTPKPTTTTPRPTTTVTTTTPTPTTTSTTTARPTTTTPIIDVTADYCSCNPNTIYLDVVFVVDTSDDMTSYLAGDATATIKSTLYGLTFGTGHYQSNVAVIAFAESVKTVVNFGGFKSTKDIGSLSIPYLGGNSDKMNEAIKQASSMVNANGREFTKGVIVLLTNSFDQRHATNIKDEARAFKDDGGIIVTIDYSTGVGIQGLEDISSTGFYINDTSTDTNLDADILYALCDANCFCKDDLTPYNVVNERGRELPKGCLRASGFSAVYEAAKDNCADEKGFVATVHDDAKNFFLILLFPVKSRYWIGLQSNGSTYEWADGSNDKFTYWAPGNPVAGQNCVYAQQQTGFNSPWYSAPCTDPLKNSMPYACQLRPCGSDYDCWL